MNYALRGHADLGVRGWGVRDLTRAVVERARLSMQHDSAKGWLEGAQPRDPRVAIALAEVLGVDPGWLYFGELSKAPAPAGYVPSRASFSVVEEEGTPVGKASGAKKRA